MIERRQRSQLHEQAIVARRRARAAWSRPPVACHLVWMMRRRVLLAMVTR
jgi:hypothetical protein